MDPATRLPPELAAALLGVPIAHRGLWSPRGAPENSLAAFEAAAAAGYGVELDVRLSRDGRVMVFHDAHLARMTGAAGELRERDGAALAALRLRDTGEAIPQLGAVLKALGDCPLVLVELKPSKGEEAALAGAVWDLLSAVARPPVAVIGFDLTVHAWFARCHPQALRGLNLPEPPTRAQGAPPGGGGPPSAPIDLGAGPPAFLLPPLSRLCEPAVQTLRASGLPLVGWTSRSEADDAAARPLCDNLIFEGYAP